jgi:hypothetical protein
MFFLVGSSAKFKNAASSVQGLSYAGDLNGNHGYEVTDNLQAVQNRLATYRVKEGSDYSVEINWQAM